MRFRTCLTLVAALFLALPARAQPAPAEVARVQVAPPLTVTAAAPPDRTAPAPGLPPALTAQDAATVLDILNDPARRAAFSAQLQAFLHATHAGAAPPPPAAIPAPPPVVAPPAVKATAAPATIPAPTAAATPPTAAKPATPAAPAPPALAPGSLGAQIVARGSSWASSLVSQVTELNRLLGNLPAVWRFLGGLTRDADTREELLRAAGQLAAVIGGAGLLAWGARRLLGRPIRALGHLAEHAAPGRVAPAARDAAASTPERRFVRLLRVLRRLPFIAARALLEALPVVLFGALGYGGLILADAGARDVMSIGVFAYAGVLTVLAATRVAVSPAHPTLRMVQLTDGGAAYVFRWMRRLSILAALGYGTVSIGAEYGMPRSAQEALIKAFSLVGHLFLVAIVLQTRRRVADAIAHGGSRHPVVSQLRARLAARWHLGAIFFIVGLWIVWAAQVRHGLERVGSFFLLTLGILVASRVLNTLLLGGLDRLLGGTDGAHPFPGLTTRAKGYLPLLRAALNGFVTVATLLALLQAWGAGVFGWFGRGSVGQLLLGVTGNVVLTALVLVAVWEGLNALLERHLARLTREAQMVRSARIRTLLPIIRAVLGFALVAIFTLSTLSRIGVDIGPLLAGAGILGVAIGFGSQKLVQDFITGIFLLLENAMQVGDWVTVAGLSGSVEALSVRTMKLRAGDGAVHVIPFSSVTTVTNVNRGIGNVPVSVTVPAEQDTDRVAELLAEVAKAMRAERRYEHMMRSDFQLWGVDKLEAGAATIVGQIVCSDEGRWPVQREFLRRVNIRFREEGVRLVAPAQTVVSVPAPTRAAPHSGDAAGAGAAAAPPPHIAADPVETPL